jgi:hypothetical protein
MKLTDLNYDMHNVYIYNKDVNLSTEEFRVFSRDFCTLCVGKGIVASKGRTLTTDNIAIDMLSARRYSETKKYS